ncbi:MAG: galactokinase family protein [Candidatus Ratteibacteria bacterium]
MKASVYLNSIKKSELIDLLKKYIEKIGNEDIIIIRVPARINLLGTHVEHRGGFINTIAIDKNLYCIAGKRNDRKVYIYDIEEEKYPEKIFDIDEELCEKNILWTDFIRKVNITPGDWANYIKAGILYFQNKFPDIKFSGLNLFFYGDIPPGAGLSSSSSLVVATMFAMVNLYNLPVKKEELPEMCGEAEWYVGTRGGSGDHASMILGKKGYITHMRFFPFYIEYIPFPEPYKVICCNSLIEAKKSANAKSIFNERVATYEIGLRLIKRKFPEIREKLNYIRDINRENLGSDCYIYKILLDLPEKLTRNKICELLPDEDLDRFFETHQEPTDGYHIRDVLLYGISECARSDICAKLLKDGKIKDFGKLMYISHDGDRIVKFLKNGKKRRWNYSVSDEYLKNLIELCKKGNKKGKIYYQPGAYKCSVEDVDYIVDLVKNIKGVLGAKITGAGLGGCVVILVDEKKVNYLLEILNEKYYKLKNLPFSAFVCESVNGVEILN